MQNLPSWFLPSVIGLLIGGTVVGTVVIQVFPEDSDKNPTPLPTPSVKNEDAIIIVRDYSTELPLEDVDLDIVTKQGTFSEKTSAAGSYRFQLLTQQLGEVYITFRRSGYKTQKNVPINFSVNQNKPTIIRLEQDSQKERKQGKREPELPESSNLTVAGLLKTPSLSPTPKYVNLTGVWDLKLTANKQVARDGFINGINGFAEYVVKFDSVDSIITGEVVGARSSLPNICSKATINGNIDGRKVNYTMQYTGICCINETVLFTGTLNDQGVLEGEGKPAKIPTSDCTLWYGTITATKRDGQ